MPEAKTAPTTRVRYGEQGEQVATDAEQDVDRLKTDVECHDHGAPDIGIAVLRRVIAQTQDTVLNDAGLVANCHLDCLAEQLLLERGGIGKEHSGCGECEP